MRLSPAELRDAIEAACAADSNPPIVQRGHEPHLVNIDGDLNLGILADILSDRLDANVAGRSFP